MNVNPIEVSYQTGRTVYCMRISLTSGATPQIYNKDTAGYENYSAANWSHYIISLTEALPGYYRAVCPTASLGTPATEIFFEQQGGSPATTDAPPIANGNSQGVNIGTINGSASDIGTDPTGIVDICNLALMHLGQTTITSLADSTQAARVCNKIFTTCRDEVLRAASWKFATVIAQLSLLSSESVVGWGYVYTFPTDCLFVRKVFDDDSNNFQFPLFPNSTPFPLPSTNPIGIEYRVIYQSDLTLQVIVANSDPAYIEYTGRVASVSLYDPMFIKALSFKLASELAMILNGDEKARDSHLKMYVLALSEAARHNAIEDGVAQREKSTYLDVR